MSLDTMDQSQTSADAGPDPFAAAKAKAAYVIDKDAPVLPSFASRGGVELVVKDDGSALVLYDAVLDEKIHWVEYDMDLDLVTFVNYSGKIFGLGLPIPAPFRRFLQKGNSLFLVYMENGENPVDLDNVVLVVRRIGF